MDRASRWVLSSLAIGSVFAACSPSPPAPPTLPKKTNLVGDDDPTRAKVDVAKNALQPFTVDWNFEHRKTIEKKVQQRGVVIVTFADKKLGFLDGCTAPGQYQFSGYSPGRSFAQARNQAELEANFPLGAATLKGRLATEGSLMADLRPVGESLLDKPRITAAELAGGPACKGATHFITKVMHGGFLFGSASAIEAAAQAGFMGVGASGGTKAAGANIESEGDLSPRDNGQDKGKKCDDADATRKQPPERCAGVLQIFMAPIDAPTPDKPVCGEGLRWNGSSCAAIAVEAAKAPPPTPVSAAKIELPAAAAPASKPAGFACDGSDPNDCLAQCKTGNARSCAMLGTFFEWGAPGVVEKDHKVAERLYDVSCKAGSLLGCAFEAALIVETPRRYAEALALGKKACDGGEPAGCTTLAYQTVRGWGVEKNEAAAFDLYARACKQREFVACNNAGVQIFFAKGTAKQDPPTACKMFERACEATGSSGCANLALCYENGVGWPKDTKKAIDLYSDSCSKGFAFACVWGGLVLEQQDKDAAARALPLYERACDYDQMGYCVGTADIISALPGAYNLDMVDRHACDGADTRGLACYNAALLHERGVNGVRRDLTKANRLFTKACKQYDMKKACRPAGSLPK